MYAGPPAGGDGELGGHHAFLSAEDARGLHVVRQAVAGRLTVGDASRVLAGGLYSDCRLLAQPADRYIEAAALPQSLVVAPRLRGA